MYQELFGNETGENLRTRGAGTGNTAVFMAAFERYAVYVVPNPEIKILLDGRVGSDVFCCPVWQIQILKAFMQIAGFQFIINHWGTTLGLSLIHI